MNHPLCINEYRALIRGSVMAIALCLCGAVKSAEYAGCVSVDLDTIIRTSRLVKQAQVKLSNEFVRRKVDLDRQQRQLLEVEFAAQTAKERGNKADEQAKLEELKQARANWEVQQSGYDADLKRRKMEVLDGLVHQAGVAYQALGTKRSYAKLFQEGNDEPIFKPLPGAEDYVCANKTDVTQEVVKEMDKSL